MRQPAKPSGLLQFQPSGYFVQGSLIETHFKSLLQSKIARQWTRQTDALKTLEKVAEKEQ